MSFANRFNAKKSQFTNKAAADSQYVKAKELAETNGLEVAYKVQAFYINKQGRYGDEPVIAGEDFLLNAPKHVLSVIEEVLQDDALIKSVNDGEVYFKLYTYQNQHGLQYGVSWVDKKDVSQFYQPKLDDEIPF